MSDQTYTNGESHDGGLAGDATGRPSRRSGRGKKTGRDDDSWWEDRSIEQKILIGIGIGLLVVGGLFLLALVTMQLWNWLMPEIFGLPRVNYWQTWGLLILSCIFFKNLGSGGGNGKSDRKRKRQLRRYMKEEQAANGEATQERPKTP